MPTYLSFRLGIFYNSGCPATFQLWRMYRKNTSPVTFLSYFILNFLRVKLPSFKRTKHLWIGRLLFSQFHNDFLIRPDFFECDNFLRYPKSYAVPPAPCFCD